MRRITLDTLVHVVATALRLTGADSDPDTILAVLDAAGINTRSRHARLAISAHARVAR